MRLCMVRACCACMPGVQGGVCRLHVCVPRAFREEAELEKFRAAGGGKALTAAEAHKVKAEYKKLLKVYKTRRSRWARDRASRLRLPPCAHACVMRVCTGVCGCARGDPGKLTCA